MVSGEPLQCQTLYTLFSDHVTGKVSPGAAPNPPKYLCEEKEELVEWIAGVHVHMLKVFER